MSFIAWALFLGAGAPGGEAGGADCVVGRTAKGYYCSPCRRELKPDDMRFPGKTCKRCDETAETIEYCVKRLPPLFRASCHPKKTSPRPFVCDGKVHNVPEIREVRARVSYRCASCEAKSATLESLDHGDDCSGSSFSVKKICSKSGKEPHVGS